MVTSPLPTTQYNATSSAGSSSGTSGSSGTSSSYGSSGTSSSSSSTASSKTLSLTPTDFINMMVTQLKNQDPMQPTSNADLLAQMSQIGQLQSADTLQTSLKSMVLQNQIGSASNLIGKSVKGMDANSNPITGTVSSVHVETDGVQLTLDDGSMLPLSNVTDIDSDSGTTGATTPNAGAATGGATTTGTAAGSTI